MKDIRRATRPQFTAEEKIHIVLEDLRGEDSIAELCRWEGIASSMCDGWSKDFLEAGKKRLAGDTARAATSDEVKDLRRKASAFKEVARPGIGLRSRPVVCRPGGRPDRPSCATRTATLNGRDDLDARGRGNRL